MSPSWLQDRVASAQNSGQAKRRQAALTLNSWRVAAGLLASLFGAVSGSALAVPGPASGTGTQRKSRALLTVLLIVPLALAAASGSNATDIGPGLIAGPFEVNSSNSPVTVLGFTAISSTGNGINAPSNAGSGVTLNINTESGPGGVISITSDGAGVVSSFPTGHTTIKA